MKFDIVDQFKTPVCRQHCLYSDDLTRASACTFEICPIDIGTLYATLVTMKLSNSTGVVCVNAAEVFRRCVGFALLDFVNTSLATGTVPRAWKHQPGDSHLQGQNHC